LLSKFVDGGVADGEDRDPVDAVDAAMATAVIDRAIEVFGGMGVSDDTPLAYFYAWARSLCIVDGPDAVPRRSREASG
jgi:hypothetical protein